jgi:hypothetical protein
MTKPKPKKTPIQIANEKNAARNEADNKRRQEVQKAAAVVRLDDKRKADAWAADYTKKQEDRLAKEKKDREALIASFAEKPKDRPFKSKAEIDIATASFINDVLALTRKYSMHQVFVIMDNNFVLGGDSTCVQGCMGTAHIGDRTKALPMLAASYSQERKMQADQLDALLKGQQP